MFSNLKFDFFLKKIIDIIIGMNKQYTEPKQTMLLEFNLVFWAPKK